MSMRVERTACACLTHAIVKVGRESWRERDICEAEAAGWSARLDAASRELVPGAS